MFCSIYIKDHAVFALFALAALGTPRTGVLVALDSAGVPLDLPTLLAAVAIAAAAGFALVTVVGDRYLRAVRRLDYSRLSAVVLAGLVGIAYLFGGLPGIGAFLASAAIGLVPARVGCRRVHCMGVLMGPLML